jgi:mRNA interferase MazF
VPINMIMVVPLTGHDRGLVTQPRVSDERSGLSRTSFARPEDLRAIDASRLQRRLGRASASELTEIRKVMRYFLDL